MLIRRATDIAPSEITPPEVFHRRRQLLGATLGAAVGGLAPAQAHAQGAPAAGGLAKLAATPGPFSTIEKQTPYKLVTTYNNYYEFGTDKTDPASYAPSGLKTRPWSVVVEGEVKKPRTFSIEDILKLAPLQERVYRLRCVERWSMVVPWIGFPLADLIRQVEPTGNAKFVQFYTLNDPKQMPGLRSGVLDWPYTDGFRLDEAMHPLTMLVVGLYGEALPNQNGAPLRVIVPWKYGFKQPKSIVRIRFVEKQPVGSWERSQPNEYGFYSNVNPSRDHPRWSQAMERRLGEEGLLNPPRKTLMFNGYADQVASLYTGMDLIKNY